MRGAKLKLLLFSRLTAAVDLRPPRLGFSNVILSLPSPSLSPSLLGTGTPHSWLPTLFLYYATFSMTSSSLG